MKDSETTASDGTGSRERSDNELIAEFMGYRKRVSGEWEDERGVPLSDGIHWFESSLDWLYPVIQKIAGYVLNTKFKGRRGLNAALSMWNPIANRLEHAMDIKLLHESVVEFIKWYNTNQKQQSS